MSSATIPSDPHKVRRSRLWLLICLAALAPAFFALTTNNIWEDFFITYRCSLNLAQGHGLVFEIGRTVHVFTSPLGTLIPAGISYLVNTDDPQVVIDIFRVFGCLMLAGAWALVASRTAGAVALAVTAGLWMMDAKLAAFSTNGMETALLVFFVILAWRSIVDEDMRLAGIALGGVMWTRPDGFVFVGALTAAAWLLQRGWRVNWPGLARMAAWGAAIYVPWFIWAWWYYGSPIPNTIVAKSNFPPDISGNLYALVTYPLRLLLGRTAADDAFLPPYYYLGGWTAFLLLWSKALTFGAVAAAAWRGCAPPARIAGLAFVLGGFYLELTPRAPWYYPAWQVLAFIAIAGLMSALVGSTVMTRRAGKIAVVSFAIFLIAIQGMVFFAVSLQLREQQQLIESGIRTMIGRDLRRLASSPQDTVFLEPLGYIGYYSGLAMRDTPGLCSPEVIALRRAGKARMPEIALALAADWVVMRGGEFTAMSTEEHVRFDEQYQYVGQYDVRPQIQALEFLPGRGFLSYDAFFIIWHKRKLAVHSS